MRTSFGPFKRKLKQPRNGDLKSHERAIVKAFDQGQHAARADELRRPPYRPTEEEDKFVAWLLGYDEVSPRYVVRHLDLPRREAQRNGDGRFAPAVPTSAG